MFEEGLREGGGDGAAAASGAFVSVLEQVVAAGVVARSSLTASGATGAASGATVAATGIAPSGHPTAAVEGFGIVPVTVEAAGARLELYPPVRGPVLVLNLDIGVVTSSEAASPSEADSSTEAASSTSSDDAQSADSTTTSDEAGPDVRRAGSAPAFDTATSPAAGSAPGSDTATCHGSNPADGRPSPWWAVVPTGAAPTPASGVLLTPGDPALTDAFSRGLVDREADAVGASMLEGLPGGPQLAALLAPLAPGQLGEASLVESVAGYERVASWAIAMQAAHVRELTDRQGLTSKAADQAAAEVAARLGSTNAVGSAKVNLAAALDTFPEVADALGTGRIDGRKANVLTSREPGLSTAEHRRVVTELLRDADRLSGPKLRNRLRAAALSANPEAGAERREKERAARKVTITAAPDGMSWITAYVRADKAHTVKVALDALADAAVAGANPGEDPRTRDQVRADAFVDLFTGVLDRGVDLAGHPLPSGRAVRAGAQITVGAGTLLGLDANAGYLAGYGPIPAELARQIAQDATWRALLTDRDGHFKDLGTRAYRPGADLTRTVQARDVTCTFPGCARPSIVCDIDHRIEYDPAIAHLVRQTSACNLHPLCRRHHNLKTTRRWDVIRERDGTLLWIPARTDHRYRHVPDPPAGAPGRANRWAALLAGSDPPF